MIEVQSTTNLRYLTYQVLGRGDVIFSRTLEVPNQPSHTFSFLATFAMVPKAQVIVYTMRKDELVSDHLEIDFGNDLQNFVTIELSTQQTTPGQEVDITVISKPNSFVGLLGIDQNVLTLRDGNDLTKSKVFSEIGQYSKTQPSWDRWNTNAWTDFNVSIIFSEK